MQEQVTDIFSRCGHDDSELISSLQELAKQLGDSVYREAFRHLVGKEFNTDVASRYWHQALAHREQFLVADRVDATLRPALLDYLHQVVRELEDPRIVEANDLEKIRTASVSDGLTGLFNQTYFKTYLEKLTNQRQPEDGADYAVLLLDLDHFKQFNDRCGHLAGDRALKDVADAIRKSIRKGDLASRYGGEEFAVVLSRVNREQAHTVAERIRAEVEETIFDGEDLLDRGTLTISGGLAFPQNGQVKAADLIQRADEELYRAKLFRNVISPHHSENRKISRQTRRTIVEFALPGSDQFAPAMSRNISPYGIALDCDRDFPEGTTLKLRFREPYWPSSRQVIASVRYIDRQSDTGLYRIGLKFNPEQALSLEASAVAG